MLVRGMDEEGVGVEEKEVGLYLDLDMYFILGSIRRKRGSTAQFDCSSSLLAASTVETGQHRTVDKLRIHSGTAVFNSR